jgi:hypothetical protein
VGELVAQVEYLVEHHEGVWTIVLNGARHGPYSTQATAAKAAIDAAHKAEALGHDVHVTIREALEAEPGSKAANRA